MDLVGSFWTSETHDMNSLLKTFAVVAALMVMFCINSAAQTSIPIREYSNRFFFEMGSASNLFGVGYERQLMKHQILLLRTGASYFSSGYMYSFPWGCNDSDCDVLLNDYYLSVPLGITYLLLPEHRAHVELGLGVIGSLQFVEEQNMQEIVTSRNDAAVYLTDYAGCDRAYKKLDKVRNTLLRGYGYFNVGYRFEAHNGFMVRTGFALIHYFDPCSRYFGSLLDCVGTYDFENLPLHCEPGTYDFKAQHHRMKPGDNEPPHLSLYFGIGFAF